MTVKEILELRSDGHLEEAYDAIRVLFKTDKGQETSLAMFWIAIDVCKSRINEGRIGEAEKIILALERMLCLVPDQNGEVATAYKDCVVSFSTAADGLRRGIRTASHLQTGNWGEELAAAYLRDKGYVILERDWHSGHRDIDIVARGMDGTVVFVEVKTRSTRYIEPALAVDREKQRNLLFSINHYLKYHHIDGGYRFDVITVVGTMGCGHPEIEHIEDFRLNIPMRVGGRRRFL